jgi:hypothetical protein
VSTVAAAKNLPMITPSVMNKTNVEKLVIRMIVMQIIEEEVIFNASGFTAGSYECLFL